MKLEKRIKSFSILGNFLKQFENNQIDNTLAELNDRHFGTFKSLIDKQHSLNGWFDTNNVLQAVKGISKMLDINELERWIANYEFKQEVKTIGVIMAGNIPLVGFHDFLSVLVAGHRIQIKVSAADSTLIKEVAYLLESIAPSFKENISFTDRLTDFDAVIVTGSDNTARYFNYYFKQYPHIIRKNRNSVAVIHHEDTLDDLQKLGVDVFSYFGLGCRNVSKLYLPVDYHINQIFEAFIDFQYVIDNNKYANNYDYNKAVYLLGKNKLLDNNFLLLKEDQSFSSPVGVLHYEFYEDEDSLNHHLSMNVEKIQCVVSNKAIINNALAFGKAQFPRLNDYADGVDTLNFLSAIS